MPYTDCEALAPMLWLVVERLRTVLPVMRVHPGGGDDAANLSGGGGADVVVVEIGHRVARDARAAAAGAEDARDLLAGGGSGRGGGVEAVRGGGAAHGVVADGVRPAVTEMPVSDAETLVDRAVHRDGADGVVGDGHRAAARPSRCQSWCRPFPKW